MNSTSSQQSYSASPSTQGQTGPAVRQLRIYSHSSLLYWWPVWAVGYVMALVTYWQGQQSISGRA